MEYKRLTRYNENTHNAEVYAYSIDKDVYFDGIDIVGNENSSLAQETIDRLAELEDKLENGTLIELPCKVGDTVWYVTSYGYGRYKVEDMRVVGFNFSTYPDEKTIWVVGAYEEQSSHIYKTEAEAKLKELKDEKI